VTSADLTNGVKLGQSTAYDSDRYSRTSSSSVGWRSRATSPPPSSAAETRTTGRPAAGLVPGRTGEQHLRNYTASPRDTPGMRPYKERPPKRPSKLRATPAVPQPRHAMGCRKKQSGSEIMHVSSYTKLVPRNLTSPLTSKQGTLTAVEKWRRGIKGHQIEVAASEAPVAISTESSSWVVRVPGSD
jgi:hypothetical protein